jgi:hypothetical protein
MKARGKWAGKLCVHLLDGQLTRVAQIRRAKLGTHLCLAQPRQFGELRTHTVQRMAGHHDASRGTEGCVAAVREGGHTSQNSPIEIVPEWSVSSAVMSTESASPVRREHDRAITWPWCCECCMRVLCMFCTLCWVVRVRVGGRCGAAHVS